LRFKKEYNDFMLNLNDEQIAELKAKHKNERDKRVADRIKTVIALNAGHSYAHVAAMLLIDESTVRRHLKEFNENKKLETNNGGSSCRLSIAEQEELVAHLKQNTYLYVKDICQYIKVNFGKKYSVSGMNKWLRLNNFRYKKPQTVPFKADPEAQKKFISEYKRIKTKLKPNETIFFVDSSHPQYQSKAVCGWIFKGQRKALAMNTGKQRLNIIGGFSLQGLKVVYSQEDAINQNSICKFLEKLRKSANKSGKDGRINLILDNASYHHGKKVKNLAKLLNISLKFLPPYSPNLNLVERIWKIMHESVRYNKFYSKFFDFKNAIIDFFKKIGRHKSKLGSRLVDNFCILPLPDPAF
jgi:transposase